MITRAMLVFTVLIYAVETQTIKASISSDVEPQERVITSYSITSYDKKQIKCLADNALMEAASEEYWGKHTQVASTIKFSIAWNKTICDMVWTPRIYSWTTITDKQWNSKYKYQKQFKGMSQWQASAKRAYTNLNRFKRLYPEEYQKSLWISEDLYLKWKLQGVVNNPYIRNHKNYVTAQLIMNDKAPRWFREHAINPVLMQDPDDPNGGHVFVELSKKSDIKNYERVKKYLRDMGVGKDSNYKA